MSIESFRLSQQSKEQLSKLKRWTGIHQWNVLCRWAFCTSLAEPNPPPNVRVPADSNVELNWRVFGGPHHELYLALLKERCHRDGLGTQGDVLSHQFKLHLQRGIGYLAGDRRLSELGGPLVKIAGD